MNVKQLTRIAMLTALTTALSLVFIIPVPQTKVLSHYAKPASIPQRCCLDQLPVHSSAV